ncbi:MAG: hypothetical protein JO265_09945 [Acidimicrobiia bacterium]|nr:hypothetical protein [Acidimicrobiia bacterium]
MRVTRIIAIAFAATATVGLAACGSGGSKSGTSATTAAPTATTAAASDVSVGQTALGAVLVDSKGRTLYHLTAESATAIKCTGACATTWPPLMVTAGHTPMGGAGVAASLLSVVSRPDGTQQAAYNGQPLYTYAHDTKAGDTNGEGVGGVWHVVKASASAPVTAAPGATTPTTATPTSTTAKASTYGGGY